MTGEATPPPPLNVSLAAWLEAIGARWAHGLEGLAAGGDDASPTPRDPDLPIARLIRALALDEAVGVLVELLLAAEYHVALARRVSELGPGQAGLAFDLAQRLIPGLAPAMLAASAPARRFEVVVVDDGPRALARLRLGEAVFDRLCGGDDLDPALDAAARPMTVAPELIPGLAEALAARGADGLSPVIALADRTVEEAAAGLVALGLKPYRLRLGALPETAEGRARWSRLWARDAALDGAVLLADAPADQAMTALLAECLDPLLGHAVIAGPVSTGAFARPVRLLAGRPGGVDPAARWRRALGPDTARRLEGLIEAASRRFRLDGATLSALAAEVGPSLETLDDAEAGRRLWRAAARAVPATPLPGVRLVEPSVTWDDIVLPASLHATLRRIETHVRHAHLVMEEWGFARAGSGRGAGVAALFSGPSGVGKTMAAEMLAGALDLRMMLIDISQITSKYIGETSKNVAAAFLEAERTGAAMVWNEGDAIWGARGSVGSATDRHVNAEVGDLLQRIEAFTGFTIVTTNLKSAIDPAFLRRFRFVADFALPGAVEREAIWRRVFPPSAPVSLAETEWPLLASVPMSGGAIRNAALGAAFAAAAEGGPIRLALVADEIANELRKTGQPMPVLDPARAVAA